MKRDMKKSKPMPLLTAAIYAGVIYATVTQTHADQVYWYTIDTGGEVTMSGSGINAVATLGQSGAVIMNSDAVIATAGFWAVANEDQAVPGDCNDNGLIDLGDAALLVNCLTGPGPQQGPVPPQCNCIDLNGDANIDLNDFAEFLLSQSDL
ncbi:MAG: dockerin type I domain-containing protein [Planctomycetota bacterium]